MVLDTARACRLAKITAGFPPLLHTSFEEVCVEGSLSLVPESLSARSFTKHRATLSRRYQKEGHNRGHGRPTWGRTINHYGFRDGFCLLKIRETISSHIGPTKPLASCNLQRLHSMPALYVHTNQEVEYPAHRDAPHQRSHVLGRVKQRHPRCCHRTAVKFAPLSRKNSRNRGTSRPWRERRSFTEFGTSGGKISLLLRRGDGPRAWGVVTSPYFNEGP